MNATNEELERNGNRLGKMLDRYNWAVSIHKGKALTSIEFVALLATYHMVRDEREQALALLDAFEYKLDQAKEHVPPEQRSGDALALIADMREQIAAWPVRN